MGAQLRAVRRRIKSVQSTAKITRAQELIASSRIIKAQQRLHEAQPYAREITRAVEAVVSRSGNVDHPLTRPVEDPKRAAVLILTSDRGFCGGFNANVLREAQSLRALLQGQGVETVTYVAGRKGIGWHRFRNRELAAEWAGFSDTPRHHNASEIAQALLDVYAKPAEEGGVDEIHVVYTEFVSMLTQRAIVWRHPAAGDREVRSNRRRPDRCPSTSSSPRPRTFSTRCCRGTSRAGCSTRCWSRRRRRSRRGGGR